MLMGTLTSSQEPLFQELASASKSSAEFPNAHGIFQEFARAPRSSPELPGARQSLASYEFSIHCNILDRLSRRRSGSVDRHRKADARDKIESRRDFAKETGAKRISNLNKIRGLERKLSKRDEELKEARQSNRIKDYKYTEMKKRANFLQNQLQQVQFNSMHGSMYQTFPRTAPGMFNQMIMPKSVSLESITVPDYILAQPAS